MSTRTEIGDRMSFAVNSLTSDLVPKKDNPATLTTDFWAAMIPFANEFLTGAVDTYYDVENGSLTITFKH